MRESSNQKNEFDQKFSDEISRQKKGKGKKRNLILCKIIDFLQDCFQSVKTYENPHTDTQMFI